MNLKIKITIIIVLTFIIGIFVGALLNRTLVHSRIKRILERRNPPHFISFYENIIAPDEDQRKQIKKILENHSQNLSEIHFEYRDELASAFQTMREDLHNILTEEQKIRLQRGAPFHPQRPGRFLWGIDIEKELSMLREKLSLTDKQVDQIKIILENIRQQARGKRGVRRWGRMDRTLDQIVSEKDKAIEDVLTEEQKKIYNQMKTDRKKEHQEMRRQRWQFMNQQIPVL
jgi:hypothetical protein